MATSERGRARTVQPATNRRGFVVPRRVVYTILGWMGMCWLVIGFFVSPALPGGWIAVLALALLTAAPILGLLRWFGGAPAPSAAARLFVIRPFWYTQLLLPLLAAAGLLGAILGLPFGAGMAGGRLAIAIVGLIGAAAGLAGYIGSRWLVVRRFDAVLPQLPAALDGLRIAQISDLHVGPHTPRGYLRKIAAAVEAARPDLIAITGDQVDDYPSDVAPFGAAFGGLKAPLGVFAIPGNHDVYAGWPEVRAGLEGLGLRVLVNDALRLQHNGASLWIAGTGDPAGGERDFGPDVERTLAPVRPGEFTIALAHNPVLWPELARRGVDLTLSGHTHYGQLAIPRLGWSMASMFLEHAMGSYQQEAALLYINPGTNYWGLPFRLGALPEVTVITLRRGEGAAAGLRAA